MENSAGVIRQPRIEYIDAMRGLAMLMVVYCHIMTFVFHNQDTGAFVFFERIMLPIFFFISGYIAFNDKKEYVAKTFLQVKFLALVIPALVCLCLYAIIFNRNLTEDIFDNFKGGYWFTIVLFEMLAISVFIIKLKEKIKLKYISLILLALVFLSVLLLKILYWTDINSNSVIRLFSVTHLLHYFPYFLTGLIFRTGNINAGDRLIDKIIDNRYIQLILVFAFIVLFYFENSTLRILQEFIGAVLVFEICRMQSDFFRSNRIGIWLTKIGRNTLQIYFVHYFILFGLFGKLSEIFPVTLNIIKVPGLELILVGTITWIISEWSMTLSNIIEKFPLMNSLLFGFKK